MNFEIKRNNKNTYKHKFFNLKKSSLNNKICCYLLIQTIIVFVLINVISQKIIVENVISLESDRMNEELSRIINELDNQLESIKYTIHDYSEWDDVYEYITAKLNNENMTKWMKFEKDNLGANSMQGLGLNAIIVLNNDAEVIYKLGYDGATINGDKIPNKLQEFIIDKEYINSLDVLSEEIGILETEQGLFLVGIHPILKNSGNGPKNGIMVMAKKLNESELSRFLPSFSIEVLDSANLKNMDAQKINILNTRNFENSYIHISKLSGYNPIVDAYGYIKDLTGEQVIKLDLNTEGSLTKNINMNRYLFLGIFLLYFIIIGFTWYFLYDNFVFRINHILKSISKLKNNVRSKIIDDEIETQDELEIVEKKIESLVDALNNHYDEIMYSANTDYLTNLYNRVGFNREIQKYIKDTNNENVKAALLFLDIDKFKNVNDVYGHNIGDEVLKRFASRLFDNAPKHSIVARTSGDEFIMFIKEYEDKEDIHELVRTLLKCLNRPYLIEDYKIKATASIGIAFYPDSSEDIEEIIVQADAAMYNVKKNGRNNFTEYKSEMKNIISGISITNAIENKEFYIEYQPQINAKTGELAGIESLLRWNSPTLGFISPNKFISIAEDTGTINELGKYVIEEVFNKVREWQDKGYKVPKTSINISPIQLINKNLSEDVMKLIHKYSLNTDNIVFEITENIAIGNNNQIFENLNHLYISGISIYIDDFGKGYSALNYLEELPISGVKIDKSFVDHIEKNDKIVKMVFALSKALNLDVVVEGVETEEQKEKVCQMGGCVIQGYLYSKPIKSEEIENKYLR